MRFITLRSFGYFLVLLAIVGCTGSKPAANSGEDGDVGTADRGKSKNNLVPVKRNVKDIQGNWVVVVTNKQSDNYRWLIKFDRGSDGKFTARILDSPKEKTDKTKNDQGKHDNHNHPEQAEDTTEITSTEIDGDSVHMVFKNVAGEFDFLGTFKDGFIRGTIRSSPFEIFLARMGPTDETSLASFDATGRPPGSDVFESKLKSNDFQPADFLNTIREYRTSPLAQDMYMMLVSAHIQAKFDEAMLTELIDAYLTAARIWGERWEARMEMAVAINLINGKTFAKMALPHLDAVEKKLGSDAEAFAQTVKGYRDAANTNIRVQELMNASTPDAVRAKAAEELVELLTRQQFNPDILLALASEADRTGNTDDAIKYLSDLVAIPMLEQMILMQRSGQPPDTPTPSELLKKLWVKKHGNDDNFREHESTVYHARIAEFLDEIRKTVPDMPTDVGNKTILVELFTGMMCPPCVGADLALSAMGKTFPNDKVAIIRFHQHVPRPDGLVNQDSEERAAFYEVPGTPLICVDGLPIDPRYYAGPLTTAWGGYSILRKVVDDHLAQKTDVVLKLSAVVTNGELTVSAEATGVPDDVLNSCRLRLAIVENNVETYGPLVTNGIRDHEYVVREMLGGAKGIPAKGGELKYSMTMPVADLQQRVVDFITRFEAGRRGEFPAELKPPIRGPLSLVAWVQNGVPDEKMHAKRILQTAMIPISGETGFGPAVAETKPNTTKPMPTAEFKEAAEPETAQAETTELTPPPPALPE